MTRINLLPPEKIKVKRKASERSYIWITILIPAVILLLIALLYVQASGKVGQKEKAVQEAKTELADWQAKNSKLQEYKSKQDEVTALEGVIVSALQGRVYWARVLNNVAIMIPSDIWLTQLSGSSEGSSGTGNVNFSGYALQCPNRNLGGFYGYYPDYKPIANWLERMATIPEFARVWLSSATPTRQGTTSVQITAEQSVTGSRVIQFQSTAYLKMETAAIGGVPKTTPAAAPAPSTTEDSNEGEPE